MSKPGNPTRRQISDEELGDEIARRFRALRVTNLHVCETGPNDVVVAGAMWTAPDKTTRRVTVTAEAVEDAIVELLTMLDVATSEGR